METNNGRTKKIKVIIISGMSGAGKTHAADWFEDHGYYCIDNMPPSLIKSFLELSTFRRIKVCKPRLSWIYAAISFSAD